jgi:hypothetical protein
MLQTFASRSDTLLSYGHRSNFSRNSWDFVCVVRGMSFDTYYIHALKTAHL